MTHILRPFGLLLLLSLFVIVAMIICAFIILINTSENKPIIVYRRTGGVIGLSEKIEIFENKNIIYLNEKTGEKKEKHVPEYIIDVIKTYYIPILKKFKGMRFESSKNITDFFKHYIQIEEDIEIIWIDPWASREPLPEEIREFTHIMKMIKQVFIFENISWKNSISKESEGLILSASLEKFVYSRNEKMEIKVKIENFGDDFIYHSPTPCHPDVRIVVDGDIVDCIDYTKP
ncbi:MAG: hypothetical protein DRJ35_06030, partial [Thermoprotei archaeon]